MRLHILEAANAGPDKKSEVKSMKTLTAKGISKQLVRLKESLSHATFIQGGQTKTVSIFKTTIADSVIRIYVYLDDTVSGTISNISLVDKDGDVVAIAERQFTKPRTKGIYSVFAYKLVEVETGGN